MIRNYERARQKEDVTHSARQLAAKSAFYSALGSAAFQGLELNEVYRGRVLEAIRAAQDELSDLDDLDALTQRLRNVRELDIMHLPVAGEPNLLALDLQRSDTPGTHIVWDLLRSDTPLVKLAGAEVNLPHRLFPDVVFTIGADWASDGVWGLGISSSLLGSAAGSAFGAIGAEAFAKYLSDNVAAGIGLPVDSDGRPSFTASVAMGHISLLALMIVPSIAFEEFDANSGAVPDEVRTTDTEQARWSSPEFAVSVLLLGRKTSRERACEGRMVPVLTLGARLPFYYPGNSFDALAALFSQERDEFLREGNVGLSLGISVPIPSVARFAKTEVKECKAGVSG